MNKTVFLFLFYKKKHIFYQFWKDPSVLRKYLIGYDTSTMPGCPCSSFSKAAVNNAWKGCNISVHGHYTVCPAGSNI